MVQKRKANLGLGGLYITQDRIDRIAISQWHSQDCAVFISLTSTALPRYRAIMGPFHWTVWLAVTIIYMLAIFPLTFSYKLTLKGLITNPEEMENMFWYVFGTFTNCFTFSGTEAWNKSDKFTTRILIGFYWLFSIIITACYTGSIIAFVTIPIYPAVVDTVRQLLDGRYQIGTLDKGGWPHLFANSSDEGTEKLLRHLDLVPDVESGLRNTTKSFIWNYAFLGSRAQLDYIVRTNFTTKSKRSILHISEDCLAPFNIGVGYPKNSIYSEILDVGILLALQAGILNKLKADVEWDMMRTATGRLLAASSKVGGIKALSYEDRALNLDDTQGMFLLLGAGFLVGAGVLMSEWLGGCFMFCKGKKRNDSVSSIESNPRSYEGRTPREKLNSIQYVRMRNRLDSTIDLEQNFDYEVPRAKRVQMKKQESNGENHVNCVVHEVADSHSSGGSKDSDDDDFNEEINKIFEEVFGEKNVDSDSSHEEVTDTCDKENVIETTT
ncbi:ionotropic receptor 21a-like [Anoplophora glabripennis]|nr:ionotropic receptor 21a-like [Anoplophora glabripennis]